MTNYSVLVANRGRARFFTLESTASDALEGGPNLIEHEDLVNPEKRLDQSARFTESKPGSGRSMEDATIHGYDDHRDEHEMDIDRKFARLVTEQVADRAVQRNCLHLVIASPSQMLALIRDHMGILKRHNLEVQTLTKDLTRLSVNQIHQHLARENYLPPRKKPSP